MPTTLKHGEANKQSEHEKSKSRSHEQSGAAQPYHPPTISTMSAPSPPNLPRTWRPCRAQPPLSHLAVAKLATPAVTLPAVLGSVRGGPGAMGPGRAAWGARPPCRRPSRTRAEAAAVAPHGSSQRLALPAVAHAMQRAFVAAAQLRRARRVVALWGVGRCTIGGDGPRSNG